MTGNPEPESAGEQPALQPIGTDAGAGVCEDGHCDIFGVRDPNVEQPNAAIQEIGRASERA